MAAKVLLELYVLLEKEEYLHIVRVMLESLVPIMERHPEAFTYMLGNLDGSLREFTTVVIVGNDVQEMIRVSNELYMPNRFVLISSKQAETIPLLKGKVSLDGKATAYVCSGRTCSAPITSVDQLCAELNS